MRLTRVFLPAPLVPGARRALPAEARAHLVRVLRLQSGDAISVFDGEGAECPARLVRASAAETLVELAGPIRNEAPARLLLALTQGISRGERMDYTVQKATELGVGEIQPVLTQHALVRLDATQGAKRLAHWRSVALSACAQCGRARAPLIHPPLTFAEYLAAPAASPAARRLVLTPEGGGSLASLARPVAAVELLVGPEGGLALEEIEALLARGATAIRLGPRVLRTETAAVAALAALQALYGDLAP
jgi:16S rRNA (uracil1498-N3)-methyltransferase